MKKRIHINQHVIRSNAKNDENKPVITIKTSKHNKYAHKVHIADACEVIYSPDKPLSCGAKVWIETDGAVYCWNDGKVTLFSGGAKPMKRATKLAHKKLVNNITHCYLDADPVQIKGGMAWYAAAYDAAYDIGNKYGVAVYLVVAVISALSPNNKWSRNVSNADALIGAFLKGDGIDSVKVSTYHAMKNKAWGILAERPTYDRAKVMLKGQKITSFFCDIMGEFNVTIDGHARNIAYNERIGLTDDKTNIGKREYKALQEAYKEAANDAGIMPYQLQAITWRVWRDRYGIT